MLKITSHQRNAHENCNEVSPYLSQNRYHPKKKKKPANADKDVGEKVSKYILVEHKLVQPFWKAIWSFLKNLKIRDTI